MHHDHIMASPSEQILSVTKANSYIARHIIAQALDKGYHVRGTVRSDATASKLCQLFEKYEKNLTVTVVSEITKAELYESAFKGAIHPVISVIHTTVPFTFAIQGNVRDLVTPAIEGSIAILEAVKRYGSQVSTSSFAAVVDPMQGLRPGYTYTVEDWPPCTYEIAKDADIVPAYSASKSLPKRLCGTLFPRKKLALPWQPLILHGYSAPIMGRYVTALTSLNVSTGILWRLVDGVEVPAPDFVSCADVRDVAAAHFAAFEKASAAGPISLIGTKFTYQDAIDVARSQIPKVQGRLPTAIENLLGRKLLPVEDTFKGTFTQLLAGEKA